jgi:hypothetical protein
VKGAGGGLDAVFPGMKGHPQPKHFGVLGLSHNRVVWVRTQVRRLLVHRHMTRLRSCVRFPLIDSGIGASPDPRR